MSSRCAQALAVRYPHCDDLLVCETVPANGGLASYAFSYSGSADKARLNPCLAASSGGARIKGWGITRPGR